MSREPLQNGTILCFPDGQECEIVRLLGAGGSALLYEGKILGSELYTAVKEIFPVRGYVRKDGLICASARLPRREKELQKRKNSLLEQETRLSQKASRRNYQVLFLQPPVWNRAELRLPDGTVFPNVENTYARMDSLAEKGVPLVQAVRECRSGGTDRLDRMLQIMETVLDAYAALHEDGFLHGDCQMTNLFLLKAGRGGEGVGTACIIDFGSARELGEDGLTAPVNDEIFSTDGYCAPELMFPRGEELRLSAAADVWSLGFLLRNLLTDRTLEDVGDITEYLMTHPEEKTLTDAEAEELGCSPAQAYLLNRILKRALSNEPSERYPNAEIMREALRKLRRCRQMDTSKGVDRYLLWEAAWRYCQADPSLFQTEHVSRLAKDMPVRYLQIQARAGGKNSTLPVSWLLQMASESGENIYLHGAGGAGKSAAAALRIQYYLKHGEKRVPLYLDLAAYTAEKLEQCGGNCDRVIPMLLAEQYFTEKTLEPQVTALLEEESCCLVLDNLHKVEASVQDAAIAALNHLSQRYSNVWVLVLGRAENPTVRAEQTRVRRNRILPPPPKPSADLRSKGRFRSRMDRKWDALFDECDAIFDAYEADEALPEEPYRALTMQHVELLPLTTEKMMEQVKRVWDDTLDFQAGTSLLKQAQTLCLPMFLMRYLELLWLDRGNSNALPNSAMALLHSYFNRQEYRTNDREVHDLLNEQLPWIAYRYGLSGEPSHATSEITAWLKERYQWELDTDVFFRHAVDNLAVLEPDSRGRYRFTHDCYQEYFSALFAANCIQQAISRDSAEPLKAIAHEWTEGKISQCLELCCLAGQTGKSVRVREEREVLDALSRTMVKLRRRELISLSDGIQNFIGYMSKAVLNGQMEWDEELLRRWKKIFARSLTGLPLVLTTLSAPLYLLLSRKNAAIAQLRALCMSSEDGKAEYQLACCYKYGEHTKVNPEKADEYLRRSEEKGYPPALNARGELEEETGNIQRALELYQEAARKQYPRAFWHLGEIRLKDRKPFEAYRQFEQGAQLGDMLSQYNLAQMIEAGFGGTQAKSKALFWYEKAAAQGLEPAKEAVKKYRAANKIE